MVLKGRKLRQVAQEMRDLLKDIYNEREASAMTWIILEQVTGSRRGQLIMRGEEVLPALQINTLGNILDELLAGAPLQYVLGETEFYGLKLHVNASVLIPRQETEELVDWIIRSESPAVTRQVAGRTPVLLDIGTGSGCIAIALKKNLPGVNVQACDVSEDALELARRNARLNRSELSFIQADILDERSWKSFPSLDIIVSNPPYITEAEKTAMAANVLDHEPHLALFVKDDDPLRFYRKIAAFARQQLRPGGRLYFEINEAFGRQTQELMTNAGFYQPELRKDLNGKDRMIRCFN